MDKFRIPALEKNFDIIRDILKGWYLPLNELYNTKRKIDSIEPLSAQFANNLPSHIRDDEKDFYTLFFKMCITISSGGLLCTLTIKNVSHGHI